MSEVSNKLNTIISNIEHITNEINEHKEELKQQYNTAKNMGFSPKIIREVIKIKNMNVNEREEHKNLLNTYLIELGLGD